MKKILKPFFIFAALLAAGCSEKGLDLSGEDESGNETVSHEMIVLGKKLDDPYSVSNVTKALASLYPTKAGRVDVTPTDIYVRFLPKSEAEYQKLVTLGYELMDHPLDYQIVKDGDYYHDPDVSEEEITWQYAVVPHSTTFPSDIYHEVLDDCFIPDPSAGTKADDGIDWEAVVRESFILTGNEDMLCPETKGGAQKPSGRITIVDEDANGRQPFGVAGVKVICNVFVKYGSAYTDRDGYYSISKKYSSKPRYRLRFKNKEGFAIGLNKILVNASTSALGKGPAAGLNATITKNSDRKLWCRSVVNNAAYDYIKRCESDDMDIKRPPKNLRIWIFQKQSASSAVMMRQGAFIDGSLIRKFLGDYASIIKLFLPDVTLGLKDRVDYDQIYSETCHELAHASHFAQVGKKYWDKYIEFIISSFVSSGGVTYGDGTEKDAGYCEVGEMWGYFMQNSMYHDRYGGSMPTSGLSHWFHPQIFRYLEERGLSKSKIFAALQSEVTSRDALRRQLLVLYPDKASVIRQVFDRYSDKGLKSE